VDGVLGTIRSIRWSPVILTPIAASAALLGADAVSGSAGGPMSLVGDAGLAFSAVALAFIMDDATGDAAPATPVDARERLVARAALAVPVAVAGWLLVLAVYHQVASSAGTAGMGERARVGAALACAAVGFAAVGGRLLAVGSPGAAGAGAMACIGAASMVSPNALLEALPPADLLCPAAVLLGLVAVALGTREPEG